MTENKQITCIVCPIGCKIMVSVKGEKVEVFSGNKCKKGVDYAIYEALDPRRVLTSSILVEGGEWPLVSVKSSKPVPKNEIFDVLKEIKKVKINAPVKIGKIIIKDVAGTDIDIIATKTIKKCS